MTETEVYKPNCCIECTFADECFSEERIKCADYEIAIKEYDRGLAAGRKEEQEKTCYCEHIQHFEKEVAELIKENAELKKDKEYLDKINNEQTEVILHLNEQIEKMKRCKNCKYSQYISCPILHAKQCSNYSKWELAE